MLKQLKHHSTCSVYITHQGGRESQYREQRSGRGEGHVLAVSRFLPHLDVGSGDVVIEGLGNHGHLRLAQRNVTSCNKKVFLTVSKVFLTIKKVFVTVG